MTNTRGERLRIARERVFKTSRQAAQAIGIPVPSYWQSEPGELPGGRGCDADNAQRLARRFGVTPEWLLTGRGEGIGESEPIVPPDTAKVPVVGHVGAGARAHFHAAAQGEVDLPPGGTASTVALEIRGESLGKGFNRWLLYYDSVRRPATRDLIGRLCVVGLGDGRVLIKQLHGGRSRGRFSLRSPNQATINDIAVEWAAGVTWMSRR